MGLAARFISSVGSLRRTAARLWPYIRTYRLLIAGATVSLFAEVAFRLAEPWPLKFVFDAVIPGPGGDEAAGPRPLEHLPVMTQVAVWAGVLVLLAGLRAAAAYGSTVGFALAGNRVLTTVRSDLVDHLQRLSLAYHARARTGDLLNRVVGDVGRLQEVAVTAALPLAAHTLTLVGMVGVMLWVNLELGLIAAASLPLFALATARLGRRIREAAREQRRREGKMAATAAEVLSSIRVVQAFGLERLMSDLFARQNRASLREGVRAARLSARLERGVDVVIALATAAVVWRGAILVTSGAISSGDLVLFLAYLKNAFKPVRDTAKFAARIAKAAASGERVVEVFDAAPDVSDRAGAVEAPHRVDELSFESVTLRYGPGAPALDSFDLTARRGERIAIVGPSGAGKTSIASILLRLYEPTAGRVLVNGMDAREFTAASLRRRVALVPQEGTIFGLTVRENIALGRPGAEERDIVRAARLASADEFIRALPLGYGSPVAERGQTLSGGQRQRIAIARAALRDAPILVLDEPAAGLDRESDRLVAAALARLGENRITLLISHDLSAASGCDQVLVLDRGRVVERGTHEELIARGGWYAAHYRLQERSGPEPDRPDDMSGPDAEVSHALEG